MMLIQLINLSSTYVLEAILPLSTPGLYLSYIMPILFLMMARWRGTVLTDASLPKWLLGNTG